jgi:hypothetical protein
MLLNMLLMTIKQGLAFLLDHGGKVRSQMLFPSGVDVVFPSGVDVVFPYQVLM